MHNLLGKHRELKNSIDMNMQDLGNHININTVYEDND